MAQDVQTDPMNERAADIAHDVFARMRGNERGTLPDHLLLAWDDLTTAQRALYTAVARAGFEEGRKR